jgi:hypothetical protein
LHGRVASFTLLILYKFGVVDVVDVVVVVGGGGGCIIVDNC